MTYGIWLYDPEAPERDWRQGSWMTKDGKVIVSENANVLTPYVTHTNNWTVKEFPGTINAIDVFRAGEGGPYKHVTPNT